MGWGMGLSWLAWMWGRGEDVEVMVLAHGVGAGAVAGAGDDLTKNQPQFFSCCRFSKFLKQAKFKNKQSCIQIVAFWALVPNPKTNNPAFKSLRSGFIPSEL
jgi:hypothetical protein